MEKENWQIESEGKMVDWEGGVKNGLEDLHPSKCVSVKWLQHRQLFEQKKKRSVNQGMGGEVFGPEVISGQSQVIHDFTAHSLLYQATLRGILSPGLFPDFWLSRQQDWPKKLCIQAYVTKLWIIQLSWGSLCAWKSVQRCTIGKIIILL